MKTHFSILLLAALTLFSCKKEEDPILGCTDPTASNYDPEAEASNNACSYSTEIHFWVQQNNWPGFGSDTLHVFSGGSEIGIVTSSAVYLAAPFCSNAGVLVYPVEHSSNQAFTYSVLNEAGNLVSSATITLSNEDCIIEEIQ